MSPRRRRNMFAVPCAFSRARRAAMGTFEPIARTRALTTNSTIRARSLSVRPPGTYMSDFIIQAEHGSDAEPVSDASFDRVAHTPAQVYRTLAKVLAIHGPLIRRGHAESVL